MAKYTYLLNMLKSIKKSEKGKLQAKCLLTFLPDTHKEIFCMSLLKDVREHSWMSHNVSFCSFAGKACVRYFLSIFYFFIKRYSCKNYEKCFLFHVTVSFCSRDIQIFVLFSPSFHTFQI